MTKTHDSIDKPARHACSKFAIGKSKSSIGIPPFGGCMNIPPRLNYKIVDRGAQEVARQGWDVGCFV